MKYGSFGRDLLLELQRNDGSSGGDPQQQHYVPAYNATLVQQCLQDFSLHCQALNDQVTAAASNNSNNNNENTPSSSSNNKPSMYVRPSILLQNAAIERNKRCLLAYHVERIRRLQNAYWQGHESTTRSSKNPTGTTCPAEEEYMVHYQTLVEQYTEALGLGEDVDFLRSHSLSLPGGLTKVDDRVQVRVVRPISKDAVVLASGMSLSLSTVGALHYLLYSDVEEYIRTGSLQIIT